MPARSVLGRRKRERLYVRPTKVRLRFLFQAVVARAGDVRRCVVAIVAGGTALAFAGDVYAESGASGTMAPEGDYVEEVIVTADRLEKGAIPTQTIIVQTYGVLRRGKRLYNERRYADALPYLLTAGKRGFKWAQAMAGDIYLHGRGGVQRDIEEGMGWLGVAARPQTAPDIQAYFRQALAEMSPTQRDRVQAVVRRYREQWSSRDWRVSCRRTVSSSPAGMGAMSLRLNKQMRCTFMHETPVCRQPLGWDTSGILDQASGPFEWVCPPVGG